MKRNIALFLIIILIMSFIESIFPSEVIAEEDIYEIILSDRSLNFSIDAEKVGIDEAYNWGYSPDTMYSAVGYSYWISSGNKVYQEPLFHFSLENIDQSREIESITLEVQKAPYTVENSPYLDVWGLENYIISDAFKRDKSVKIADQIPITNATNTLSFDVTSFILSQLPHQKAAFVFGGPTESIDPDNPTENRNFVLFNYKNTGKEPKLIVKYKPDPRPSGKITILGNGYTNSKNVNLQIDASSLDGGPIEMRLGNNKDSWVTGWIPYNATMDWMIPEYDGNKTVYLQLRNQHGVKPTIYEANIILDTVMPTGNLVINNGDSDTKNPTVALLIEGDDTNLAEMQISNKKNEWPNEWLPFSNNINWTVAAPTIEEEKTVYIRLKDKAGNISDTFSDSIDLVLYPLIDGVIDGGVYNTDITTIVAPRVKAINMNGIPIMLRGYRDTEPYQLKFVQTGKITLEIITLRDEKSFLTFLIDKDAPVGTININGGDSYSNSTTVLLHVTAQDTGGSDHVQMRFSNDYQTWSDWEDFVESKSWNLTEEGNNQKTVYMQLRDLAGNISDYEQTITYKSLPAPKDHLISGWIEQPYYFQKQDFHYINEDNTEIDAIKIESLPEYGLLIFKGEEVTVNQSIPFADIDELMFMPPHAWSGITDFKWKASNGCEYSNEIGNVKFEIDMDPEEPIIIRNPSREWTNGPVELEIEDGKTGLSGLDKTQYRIGEKGKWQNYDSPITIEESGVHNIYARTIDNAGNVGEESHSVVKIDKTKPTIPKISLSDNLWTTTGVTVMIEDGITGPSGIAETQFKIGENGTWRIYHTPITIEKSGMQTIYARTLDVAGNVGEETQVVVKIDNITPSAPTITLSGRDWTNQPVEVKIMAGNPGPSGVAKTEYRIGEKGTWKTYQFPIKLEATGEYTIYARTVDRTGNLGNEAQANFRIERISPTISINIIDMSVNEDNVVDYEKENAGLADVNDNESLTAIPIVEDRKNKAMENIAQPSKKDEIEKEQPSNTSTHLEWKVVVGTMLLISIATLSIWYRMRR
ncbi:OmpL47-type beta-barrel domain-containing protein [Ornithinibacillus xuwenensis]|uniref:Ig-like domain-containing protein n=1 Tax=Ornithinibacillus xuwenensis TaxID=3144668 RepID=A0ABU9XMK8_9BACI